jgi:hypothetical protein
VEAAAGAIARADALLELFAGSLPYQVRPRSRLGRAMLEQAAALHAYADGTRTAQCEPAPAACQDP